MKNKITFLLQPIFFGLVLNLLTTYITIVRLIEVESSPGRDAIHKSRTINPFFHR